MSDLKTDKQIRKGRPYQVELAPLGRRGRFLPGVSVMEMARQLGVDLISLCGGVGKCGQCKVQIVRGQVSAPTSAEQEILDDKELGYGYRLACQTYAKGDLIVHIPPESLSTPQRIQVEGIEPDVMPEPLVREYEIRMSAPSLSDLQADDDQLTEELKQQHNVDCSSMDTLVLRKLSTELRSQNWRVQATMRDSELIDIGPWPSRQLGLAVDLGTTKVAVYLLDLESGKTVASKGIMNPQIAYGEDVITRINLARRGSDKAKRMQNLIVEAINSVAAELSAQVDAGPEQIVDAVVVGNTAMHHLLLRLPVDQLACAPHVLSVRQALDIKARELRLSISPGAYIHFLPNIAGFVGADHVAVVLSTGVFKAKGLVLAVDVGTNTEICLANKGKMTSVSCASGPAFEGAHIKFGMRAAAGAIERLRFVDQEIEYHTIEDRKPIGICGSGILDTMAQLYIAGVLDRDGRMTENHPNVRSYEKGREFIVINEDESEGSAAITITQQDVRQLQLAKAAIRAGIQILLNEENHSEDDIDQVIVAGAFGSYMDISSAIAIGMFPQLPLDRFNQVGNAAGAGARSALISQTKRTEALDIALQIRYIELAGVPNFGEIFLQALALG